MKKSTLGLLIALVFCLALPATAALVRQREADTMYNQSSSGDGTADSNSGSSTDDSADSNSDNGADDSAGSNSDNGAGDSAGSNSDNGADDSIGGGSSSGSNSDSSADDSAGSNTGKNSDKNTGKKSGRNTGKNAGKSADKNAGSAGGNTGKNIGSNTGSSTGSGTDSNMGSSAGSSFNGNANSNADSSTDSDPVGSAGGESTTPPTQEKKIIEGIGTVKDTTVDYGTAKEAAIAKLPKTVALNCKGGSKVQARVTSWELTGTYDSEPDTQAAYTATGTVAIPAGCSYSGTPLTATARLIVRGGDTVITEIIEPEDLEVDYNTSREDAEKRLPDEVTLKTKNTEAFAFGTVKWKLKSGQAYNAAPEAEASVTYTGTVKIPDGCRYDNTKTFAKTIEITIKVMPEGIPAKKKLVSNRSAQVEIPIPYTTYEADIEASLPEKIRLYCTDSSPITVTVNKEHWTSAGTADSSGDYKKKHSYQYAYGNIGQLPDGYAFDPGINVNSAHATAAVLVRNRDDSRLQAAKVAAANLFEGITPFEDIALKPGKFFLADDGTVPSQVAAGVRFVLKGQAESQIEELRSIYWVAQSDYLNSEGKSQAEVDALAEEINAKTAALKKILDKAQTGTRFKEENIWNETRKALTAFEGKGIYAYDPAIQPLRPGKQYTLPEYVMAKTSANGTKSKVMLKWEVTNSNGMNIDTSGRDENGNIVVKVIDNPVGEPGSIAIMAFAEGYYAGNSFISLNDEQMEAYNNICVGHPVVMDESKVKEEDIPRLTSGAESSFSVKVPFKYSEYNKMIDINIDPGQIQVTESTSGKALLSGLKVTGVHTDQNVPVFDLTAAAAELPADGGSYKECSVKLSIPAAAITLTEYAIENNWYIPDGSWEVEAAVRVYPPVVTVNSAQLSGDRSQEGNAVEDGPEPDAEEQNSAVTVEGAQLSDDRSQITVAFSTVHWKGTVQTALVPAAESTFDGTGAGSLTAPDAVTVEEDGAYTAVLPAAGLPAGDYTVWIKTGDGEWQKSAITYTHTDAPSDTGTAPGSEGSEGSQDALVPGNDPEPEAEENDPADPAASVDPDENCENDIIENEEA